MKNLLLRLKRFDPTASKKDMNNLGLDKKCLLQNNCK